MNRENFKVAEFCYRGQDALITKYMFDMQKIPAFDQDWEFLMSAIASVRQHYSTVRYIENHTVLHDMYVALMDSLQLCEKDRIYPRLIDYINVWSMLKPKDHDLCKVPEDTASTME